MLKVVEGKYFEVQQFDLIIDKRLRISDLFIRKLSLELVHIHTGNIPLPVTGQVQVIGTLRICDVLLGYLYLRKQVLQTAPSLADIQFDIDFVFIFWATSCALTRAFFSPQSKMGTLKLMATRGFCVGLL